LADASRVPRLWPVLLALVLGAAVGLTGAATPLEPALRLVGDVFLLGLKMAVPPLIFASIVTGMASLGRVAAMGRVIRVTLFYFLGSMSLAVATGLLLVNAIRPGVGVNLGLAASVPERFHRYESVGALEFAHRQLTGALVNPFAALAEMNVLGIIVYALLFGAGLAVLGRKGQAGLAFFESVNEAAMWVAGLFIRMAPYGAFALLALALSRGGVGALLALGKYSLTVIAGLAVHAAVTLPALLWVFAGVSPWKFYVAMRPAVAVAFATASSNATLPVTLACVGKLLAVPERIARFVCPVGATANMNGTALYEAVAAVFIAQAYGIELSLPAQVLVFVTATLAAIGAAGIPEAGLVTMALVLNAVGLPLEGIGLILAVDKLLDMCRTAVNVCDDGVGAAIVARWAT
jgi:proton glutamate symport protein